MTRHRTRLVVVGLAAVVLFVWPSAGTTRADRPHAAVGRMRCLHPVDAGAFAAENVLAAVRRVLRRRTLTNQGGTSHLTPGAYEIDKLLSLGGSSKDADRAHYRAASASPLRRTRRRVQLARPHPSVAGAACAA